jgi:hypothetical protein
MTSRRPQKTPPKPSKFGAYTKLFFNCFDVFEIIMNHASSGTYTDEKVLRMQAIRNGKVTMKPERLNLL